MAALGGFSRHFNPLVPQTPLKWVGEGIPVGTLHLQLQVLPLP